MKIKQGKPFIVCSGYDQHINIDRTLSLVSDLVRRGYSYKYVKGCYKGKQENSVLIYAQHGAIDYDLLFLLRDKYYQESYLYVDQWRDALLVHLLPNRNGEGSLNLGKFVRAKLNDVSNYDAWTQDVKTGQYWICDRAA
jgi:hypothetical protein